MKTHPDFLRQGIALVLLETILQESKDRGYDRVILETGAMDAFLPARALYSRFGFSECPPFADYVEDPHSMCMTIWLDQ